MLCVALGITATGGSVTYSDVPRDHWGYSYICVAVAKGWATGEGGKFRPDQPITRPRPPRSPTSPWAAPGDGFAADRNEQKFHRRAQQPLGLPPCGRGRRAQGGHQRGHRHRHHHRQRGAGAHRPGYQLRHPHRPEHRGRGHGAVHRQQRLGAGAHRQRRHRVCEQHLHHGTYQLQPWAQHRPQREPVRRGQRPGHRHRRPAAAGIPR